MSRVRSGVQVRGSVQSSGKGPAFGLGFGFRVRVPSSVWRSRSGFGSSGVPAPSSVGSSGSGFGSGFGSRVQSGVQVRSSVPGSDRGAEFRVRVRVRVQVRVQVRIQVRVPVRVGKGWGSGSSLVLGSNTRRGKGLGFEFGFSSECNSVAGPGAANLVRLRFSQVAARAQHMRSRRSV